VAGLHDRRNGGGWWRHRSGGFGWVGPLFWPFAYYDVYDYTLWGYGSDEPFWDYGYGDIYAGIFSPYAYSELSGYSLQGDGRAPVSRRHDRNRRSSTADRSAQLTRMCGDEGRNIAGLPIDQIQQAIQPDDAQRAALDDLANASVRAAEEIRSACPSEIPANAPARLAAMQRRIEAMISAVEIVQSPLQKFYDLLNDEQKARLNSLGPDQRGIRSAKNDGNANNDNCGATQSGVTDWPVDEINARVRPGEAQHASLTALQDASAKAADILKSSCQTSEAITPPARLEAVRNRLNAMLQAVQTVRAPLEDFYSQLSDEQKAQFEAIGPRRSTVASRHSSAAPPHHHGRRHAGIGGIIRHLVSMMR
jgi:LTXXQ motif family protein